MGGIVGHSSPTVADTGPCYLVTSGVTTFSRRQQYGTPASFIPKMIRTDPCSTRTDQTGLGTSQEENQICAAWSGKGGNTCQYK